MKKIKYISFLLIMSLNLQCVVGLAVPDITGYIAALVSLIPKSKQSNSLDYDIRATVTGLSGTGLVIQNNGADNLTIAANGNYSFSKKLKGNSSYNITVLTQPQNPSQTCNVSGGTGAVVNGDVTSIVVNCATNTYTVGGTVTGLAGAGLILQDSNGQIQTMAANGSFAFGTAFRWGTAYSVTIQTQPLTPTQTCTITSGSGIVTSSNISSIAITCTTNTYTVGGTLTGLLGTGLVLQNNGGDNLPLAADGSFTFATSVNSAATYTVTVLTQPSTPTQTCIVTGGSGTIVSGNISSVTVNCSTNTYTIGGTVTGLAGSGLVLQDNGGDNLPLAANGAFAFATPLNSGVGYTVTVLTQPATPTQTCIVTSGSGTVSGVNITTVAVNCTTNTYTVGGTVSGLSGSGMILQNNGGDNLSVSTNGVFTFATSINSGAAYVATVLTQPSTPTQNCIVSVGSGTVVSANITSITINCTTNTYTVGGTVAGLIGTGMVLQNNGGDNLTVSANGAFAFSTAISSGVGYTVTILTQPTVPFQTCVVSTGSGTVTNANITTVSITCGAAQYSVGGTISGLTSTGLVLQDSVSSQTLGIAANGAFTFTTYYANASTYSAYIQTQPTGQYCEVTSGSSGTIISANVTNIVMTCFASGQNISNQLNGISGSNTEILMNCMQYDSATNSIYMAGIVTGGGALDGEVNPSGVGFKSAFISKYDTNGNRQWTRIESAGAGFHTQASGLAIDSAGNAYITGTVFGTGANLNGNTVSNTNASFVIKYNSSGVRQWTSGRFGQRNDGRYVGIDSAGNIYVTGTVQSSNLDGVNNTGWTDDGFTLVKYDSNGNWLATQVVGGSYSTEGNMYGYGIAFDSSNNIYVAVASTSVAHCGPGPTRSYNGPALFRFDTAMTYLGCTGYTGISGVQSEPFSIVSDTSNNFYITGYTRGNIEGLSLAGAAANMFVSKLDSSGNKLWTQVMGATGDTVATSIARSPQNFLYVMGYTQGNINGQTLNGVQDMFITKYDLNGTIIWTRLLGSSGSTTGNAGNGGGGILVDSFNTIYAGSTSNGNIGAAVNPVAPNYAFLISRFAR